MFNEIMTNFPIATVVECTPTGTWPIIIELPINTSHIVNILHIPSSSLLFKRGSEASTLLDLG